VPCRRSSHTRASWVLAVVVCRLCMSCQGHAFGVTPLLASTPTWAFMPKNQSLPFLVDDISGSRAPALFFVEFKRQAIDPVDQS
jgi:hypothetical protein